MDNQKKIMLLSTGALALAALLLWLGTTTPVQAVPAAYPLPSVPTRYVAPPPTGDDASNDCSNSASPCATIQHAIDEADPDDQIHVAGGTYTGASTVAVITKSLAIVGCYDPTFPSPDPDPDMYRTVLNAQWGGSVISITSADDVLLRQLTLTHGDGTGNCSSVGAGCGGGIYVRDTTLHVGRCVITDNVGSRVGGGLGGGMYACDSNVDMWSSLIVSNTASADPSATLGGYGGGIYLKSPSGAHSASLQDSQFLDNVGHVSDQGRGGGIYLTGLAGAEVLTNTIRGNRSTLDNATSGWGGGLDIEKCSGVYVAGNRLENNVTHPNPAYGGYGGGVYVESSDAHLTRNTIVSNTTSQGSGVFIRSEQPVTLSNNLIARNLYVGVYVVEYYAPSVSRAVLVNNTIADNGYSGVVAQTYAVVTLTNNLIAGHTIGLDTPTPFSSTISANTNLFWNTSDLITGTNGIRQDPKLTADYHLGAGSPALDAGLTIPWLTTDLDGKPRTPGEYDIGAFEGAWWTVFLPLVLR
jgi:hypothetical protein